MFPLSPMVEAPNSSHSRAESVPSFSFSMPASVRRARVSLRSSRVQMLVARSCGLSKSENFTKSSNRGSGIATRMGMNSSVVASLYSRTPFPSQSWRSEVCADTPSISAGFTASALEP